MTEAISDYPYTHQTAIVKKSRNDENTVAGFFSLIGYCRAIKPIPGTAENCSSKVKTPTIKGH